MCVCMCACACACVCVSQCPYELVIPTMRQGIQLAMAVTSAFTGLGEGEGDPTKPRVIKPKRDEL